MTTHKLTKGQLLYREKRVRGSYRQPAVEREIEALEVDTVGSKYFTVGQDPHTRYVQATLRDEYNHYPALCLQEQEIRDEWERETLQRELRRVLEYQAVPLEVLRQLALLVPEQLATVRKPLPALS